MSGDVAVENNIHIQNGGSCEVFQSNGVTTNGHHHHHSSSGSSGSKHKSSSKDKHRDKDREHKSSGSSSSSKDHKSSSRDKDRHKSSSSSSSKHRDKDKERDGSSSSHRSSSSSSHRDKDGSSSGKHKSSSSSSSSSGHHKSSSKDKERRDKDKDRSSSSSSSRHKSSSSRDKERSSSSSHKSSSSSSSSSKSKHSSSRHSSSSSSSKEPPSYDGVFVKPEPVSQPLMHSGHVDPFQMQQLGGYDASTAINCNGNGNDGGANYKNGYEESIVDIKKEDESFNNLSQASSCDYSMSQFRSDEPPFEVKHEQSYTEEDSNINDQYDEAENEMDDDEEDVPLAMRKRKQEEPDQADGGMDDDDIPLLARKKIKKEHKDKTKKKRVMMEAGDEYDIVKPKKKKIKQESVVKIETVSPTKRQKIKEEEEEVWRWWEEEKRADGVKWTTLEHKGPVFAPPYERVPRNVRFYYDGKPLELSEETEEAATFYAKMLNHDYCTKDVFNNNFFKDFRKSMTSKEKEIIKDFRKCNFQEMFNFFQAESEKRKAASKEEKLIKKNENEALMKEYGFCMIDGHKEKIGNFRLEPPGLFRGRGEHPKMGMIKRRIQASDVSINCGKESTVPSPPSGSRWKEVRHDNTVTWLASWIENVQGQVKYIMLNPSSKLKGEKDHIKYETARRLDKVIDKIRATYRDEWKSKEMRVRQRAVALYFIDKLALRAGNEKDEDQADTVGCCSLRVEHVQLHKELNGKENVVVFDFPGKDSIRYYNEVEVEKRVFKNLELFMEHKKEGDDLFDRLNTQVLNEHLKELMDGLTAKVFRTYNASKTLQSQLDLLTDPSATVPEKLLAYNRANRAVAILCNHQRSVPKGHEKSMENLKEKIKAKRDAIDDCEAEYHDLKKAAKRGSVKEKVNADKKGKQLERLKDQLKKLELQETDRDENKTIALGTSKLNYLDPRISVAWCKKHGVPIEKIFNKTQRTKFLWAVHMADENYRF
ncbi:DNA topoisomerase 1 isoform X1 [Drosophila elegans]|uniref:DNA topoisomerase 1 isoform X1 n=1 Tax=Drosophila elegans TaxID=30023 RepID=UPI0007E6737C|nr:DNA topoisomerase 1 isoform X1 [Drosophila elegans]